MRMKDVNFRQIAVVNSAFPEKFGIPRQSGLVPELYSEIVFLPEFGKEEALRGIEEFSHLWIIWYFSENDREKWSPTVRPPRLGGNERVGVFATRSPFRPNPVGLSLVKLEGVGKKNDGRLFLKVSGADIMDKTPVFDIKPYIPFSDSVPDAKYGFAAKVEDKKLAVAFSEAAEKNISDELKKTFVGILEQDPRPAYQNDPDRVYSFEMFGFNVSFTVANGILTVISVKKGDRYGYTY